MLNFSQYSEFSLDYTRQCAFSYCISLVDLGGGGGERAGHTPPPMGPNSFIFAYIFTKKCPHWRSTPPLMGACPPWEILDPPLHMAQGRIQDLIRGGPQIMTGLKLPFWGLSFGAGASFLVVRGGARAPGAPPWIRPCGPLISRQISHIRPIHV